eukprot:TRINITY_DN2490_c0_g1_i1.p1 TRINITY_DN2490_c0_g1~~TRINITY_DN2490_c0_g1_i1.p1  ORF type:complete len:111 (+),score=2.71 TRINITY_DN2490_c0_g1_i1:3-335(+)
MLFFINSRVVWVLFILFSVFFPTILLGTDLFFLIQVIFFNILFNNFIRFLSSSVIMVSVSCRRSPGSSFPLFRRPIIPTPSVVSSIITVVVSASSIISISVIPFRIITII